MNNLAHLYRHSLALLTDFYQITMAYGFWKSGKADSQAVYELSFRSNPFDGGFTIACGLENVIDYLENFRFQNEDIEYLATIKGNDGKTLFEPNFLTYLQEMHFSCDIDAVPEGTVVFPNEPLIRVSGPIIQCQLLETPLLTITNFQTLIATKAARICGVTKEEPVLEFGLRRAQGIDGGLAASRAAFIGGCAGTSNVLAGKLYDIPVKGTHAHSWIMAFPTEFEAFKAYAEALPNNCIFLVDTYDTINGVKRAIKIGKMLRENGHKMIGIRLDSGDLAYLSIEARKLLDQAGFEQSRIVASNELDEHIIQSMKEQGAQITVWGIGTKLVTGNDQPALGGVYKLTALKDPGSDWHYKLKISEHRIKISNPGIHQVRRFYKNGLSAADAIYDIHKSRLENMVIVDPLDHTRRKMLSTDGEFEDLLVPIFREGQLVYEKPSIHEIKKRTQTQLSAFHSGIKRFVNPHQYPVGLEKHLNDLKLQLILQARGI